MQRLKWITEEASASSSVLTLLSYWQAWGGSGRLHLLNWVWALLVMESFMEMCCPRLAPAPDTWLHQIVKMTARATVLLCFYPQNSGLQSGGAAAQGLLELLGSTLVGGDQLAAAVMQRMQVHAGCSEAASAAQGTDDGSPVGAAVLEQRWNTATAVLLQPQKLQRPLLPPPQSLHLDLRKLSPEDLTEEFGQALLDAVAKQGFLLQQSFIMPGSVKLTVVLSSRESWHANDLDVESMLAHMLRSGEANRNLLMDARIQWGNTLFYLRDGAVVWKEDAQVPVIRNASPRVLPANTEVELDVILSINNRQAVPAGLSLVLRGNGTALELPMPCELWHVQRRLLHVTQMVMVKHSTLRPYADVALLEVFDGEVYSAPVPVLASSDPQLVREVAGLLSWLSSRVDAFMSCEDLLWALRYVYDLDLDLHEGVEVDTKLAAQQASEAGEEGAAASRDNMRQLCAAQRVQAAAPAVLSLAVMMGMPGLVRLLLRKATAAFLPVFRRAERAPPPPRLEKGAPRQAPQQPPPERKAEPTTPQPCGVVVSRERGEAAGTGCDGGHGQPMSAMAAAFCRFLEAVGSSGPLDATVLHLVVTSASGETVKVLQDEAALHGLQLNWKAAFVPSGLERDGGEQRRAWTAMELAVLLLPKSGRVVRQALRGRGGGGAAAAEAWWQALAGVTPGGDEPGEPLSQQEASVSTWVRELSKMARTDNSAQPVMGPLLRFQDGRLERAWRAEVAKDASGLSLALRMLGLMTSAFTLMLLGTNSRLYTAPAWSFLFCWLCHALLLGATLLGVQKQALTVLLNLLYQAGTWLLMLYSLPSLVQLEGWSRDLLSALVLSVVLPLAAPLPVRYQMWTTLFNFAVGSAVVRQPAQSAPERWWPKLVATAACCTAVWSQRDLEQRHRRSWLRTQS